MDTYVTCPLCNGDGYLSRNPGCYPDGCALCDTSGVVWEGDYAMCVMLADDMRQHAKTPLRRSYCAHKSLLQGIGLTPYGGRRSLPLYFARFRASLVCVL